MFNGADRSLGPRHAVMPLSGHFVRDATRCAAKSTYGTGAVGDDVEFDVPDVPDYCSTSTR